jgi:hypothetical protein
MAEETGGEAIFPQTMKEIELAYDRVVAGIRAAVHAWVLFHQPRRVTVRWRRVEVKVTGPGAVARPACLVRKATSPHSSGPEGSGPVVRSDVALPAKGPRRICPRPERTIQAGQRLHSPR